MAIALSTLAYLDPGDSTTPVWQWVVVGGAGVVLLLLLVYVVARFAARR